MAGLLSALKKKKKRGLISTIFISLNVAIPFVPMRLLVKNTIHKLLR